MITKETIIASINRLPDKFTVEDIIEQIVLLEKIEKGLEDSRNGKLTPDEEVDKKLSKWLD